MRSRLVLSALLALSVSACPKKQPPPETPDPAPDEIIKPESEYIERDPAPEPEAAKKKAPPPEVEFASWCSDTIALAQAELDKVVAGDSATVETVLVPLNRMLMHLDNAGSKGNLYSEVHPDAKMREAGQVCVQRYSTFASDFTLNRAVFDKVKAIDTKQGDVGPDTLRFRERLLRDARRAGVDKDDKARARLKELNDEETKVGQEFDKNIREDVRKVQLDPAQLDGMPDDWKAAHPVENGKVTVTTDYPDVNPFRTYAKDADARMALYKEYLNRGWPANDTVLKKLFAVRQERAKLLGYKNWGDYITEDKMIKSGKAARDFIEKITKLSTKRAKADYGVLLARYKKDNPKAKAIQLSDALYYEELIRREDLQLDSQEVRKYFDYEQSKAGLLLITGRLFGIEYRPVKDAEKWHADVDVYDVYQVDGGDKLGRIYLDMFPRDGKYKHAAQFSITSGVQGVQLPSGALVCNFSRGLMNHDEVVTMFHEFGHLVHHILGGQVEYAIFSGVATERDFVEAPSQLLEEWAWDPETLALFAKDKDGKAIPAELVAQMRAAELFGEGYRVRTQMFYASMSLRYHTLDASKDFDATKILAEEQKKYSMFPYVPDTHMQVNFGHLNGYSAMYYTYMWSLVIAKDMFSAFQKAGMLDQETAYRYRDKLLAMGGRKDAADLVADFLGRKYSFASFQAYLENKQPKK